MSNYIHKVEIKVDQEKFQKEISDLLKKAKKINKKRTTFSFENITFHNRWKDSKSCRNLDWTIIGISEWWHSYYLFCLKFSFFGFDLKMWFNRRL